MRGQKKRKAASRRLVVTLPKPDGEMLRAVLIRINHNLLHQTPELNELLALLDEMRELQTPNSDGLTERATAAYMEIIPDAHEVARRAQIIMAQWFPPLLKKQFSVDAEIRFGKNVGYEGPAEYETRLFIAAMLMYLYWPTSFAAYAALLLFED